VVGPWDRNKPQIQVSFRYDPLGRRISKTRRQLRAGEPSGRTVTTRFVWDGLRLLQEIHDDVPLTYVYSNQESYDPLARIDGIGDPEIYWFHNQPNGLPERLTDAEGELRWEAQNSVWGKLLRETPLQAPAYAQNPRMQGQYLDRLALQSFPLLRPGLRTLYPAGPDRAGGRDKSVPVCTECAYLDRSVRPRYLSCDRMQC